MSTHPSEFNMKWLNVSARAFQGTKIDAKRSEAIAATLRYLLKRQKDEVMDFFLEDTSRGINGRAVGYLYGFAQAALQRADVPLESAEGQHIFVDVLNSFGETRGVELVSQLLEHITDNPNFIKGTQLGRADYDAWINSGGLKSPAGLKACYA